MTDSATGGYLLPQQDPSPLEDDALDDFLQEVVVGITGLPGAMVRPRWQDQEPILPPQGTDWAAIGIMSRDGDTYSTEMHDPSGDGSDNIIRHETLNVVATFYGPNCQGLGALLRDGLGLAQNRERLFSAQMGLRAIGQLARSPELVKGNWLGKTDLPFSIRRVIVRNYPVLNLRQLNGGLNTDNGAPPITLTTPKA